MNSLSDNALMLKVKAGDNQRLGLLYERYKKRLFGFFYQMNKDAGLSEDLVQNVFIRILKYKHTYTEDGKFVTWVFQIARNEIYDNFRKSKKYQYQDVKDVDNGLFSEYNIQEIIVKDEDMKTLTRALQLLPLEKRELLILSKYEELKYKEIGKIIGCTEGAARTKLHRAMHDLKTTFLSLEKR